MQKRRRRNARRSRLCERREIRKDRRPKPGAFLGAQLASRTPWDSYNRCWSACVSNCRSARCCAKIYLPEFFLSGAGVAVANIPHSDCTVFTPVTARQPSLIALGERFKALGSVYQLCVVFGNRQNKAVLAFFLTTSSYSAGCPIGPRRHDAALIEDLKAVEWTCPIGEVIPGWPEQSILLNVAAPRPFVPPDGVDEP